MVLTDNWFTALSENEDGSITFISGRSGIDEFIKSGKMKQRVEVTWKYEADAKECLPTTRKHRSWKL